jgi:dolichol-phosphate mannosyltransferase
MDAVELSVVAPCFNEELVLPEFYRRVSAACAGTGLAYEVVLVNDGSRDGTWKVMEDLARKDPSLTCVNLARNHGHQLALTAGLYVCRGQRVLIIDADLQDPPELLPAMLARLEAGADVVYGQRRKRTGETLFKRATAALFYRLVERLASVPIPRDTGDFRLMTRRALEVLLAMPERHRFIRGMVSWIGFRQEPLLYDRDPRFAGETKYTLRKMLRFAADAVTGFSIKPLALASFVGLFACGAALVVGVAAVINGLLGGSLGGWLGLTSLVTLLAGVQLLALGILGEYLGRLYEESKGRPLFVIERIIGQGHPATEAVTPERATIRIGSSGAARVVGGSSKVA